MDKENNIIQLLSYCKSLELDHDPDGWPAIQMWQISKLYKAIEGAIPSLDLLQAYLEKGAYIDFQDNKWWLFSKDGNGIAGGETIRAMLINLIFLKC